MWWFLGGVAVGVMLMLGARFIFCGSGLFYIVPYEDPDADLPIEGLYTVNVALQKGQNLAKKGYIILKKDISQQ